jgi:selenocysteine lyase/cysteine desulfurase
MTWEEVRREFPCTRQQVFLNTGTLGPVPARVMRAYLEGLASWNAAGPGNPSVYIGWRDRVEATREALAGWLGTQADCLTFTENVTDAINIGLNGLRLPSGSRVLTSDQEHGALVAPLALLAERGVTVEIIPYEQGGEPFLARLRESFREPVDLVALSHLSCETGAWVDAEALAQLCHEHGALLMLDGAQTPGQLAVNLTKIQADLYAMNGHKWMLAPVGCGALYIRPEIRDRVHLTYTGDGPGWNSSYPDAIDSQRPANGSRFEYGTRNWPAWVAWGDVLRFWESLPQEAAYRRQRELAAVLAGRLKDLPGVTIWSPELPIGGIVTFTVTGLSATELNEALRQKGIIGRGVGRAIQGARLCTAFYNNLDDIGRAVEAVSEIVMKP